MFAEVIINQILKRIDDLMYQEFGCVDFNAKAHCFINGYYSWEDTLDAEGNIADSVQVITYKNLQEACNDLGLDIDCMNW